MKKRLYFEKHLEAQNEIEKVLGHTKTLTPKEIKEEVKSIKKKGNDPKKEGFPLGDNCKGYLLLRDINQGYDV